MLIGKAERITCVIEIEKNDSGAWMVNIFNPDQPKTLLFALNIGTDEANAEYVRMLGEMLIECVNKPTEDDMKVRDEIRKLQELCAEKGAGYSADKRQFMIMEPGIRPDGTVVEGPSRFIRQYDLSETGIAEAISWVKDGCPVEESSTEIEVDVATEMLNIPKIELEISAPASFRDIDENNLEVLHDADGNPVEVPKVELTPGEVPEAEELLPFPGAPRDWFRDVSEEKIKDLKDAQTARSTGGYQVGLEFTPGYVSVSCKIETDGLKADIDPVAWPFELTEEGITEAIECINNLKPTQENANDE